MLCVPTRLIAERLPDAVLALLPGDHFIANRQHEAFNRVVAQFLRTRPPR